MTDMSNLRAGTYTKNITPPIGITLEGSLGEIIAERIVDDLYVNAVVIDDNTKEIAIVSADIHSIPNAVYKDMAARIKKEAAIDEDNILIAATHTHCSPCLDGGPLNTHVVWDDYVEQFKKSVVTAVCMAKKSKQTVRIGAGKGNNPDHVFNRRLKKPDGSIAMNWLKSEFLADCIDDGVVDPELLVIKIADAEGNPKAFIVNYSLHNNACGGPIISSDLSGHMCRVLKKVYGEDVCVLFIPGAIGNINWINYKEDRRKIPNLYKLIGTGIAGTVLEIDSVMKYQEVLNIDVLHKKLQIPDRPYCEYDTHVDTTFGEANSDNHFFKVFRRGKEILGHSLPMNDVDIQTIKLGDEIAIVASPTQMFVEFGLEIKACSPFKYTLFAGMSNGNMGYVPTEQAFKEGGYEVRKLPINSHLDISAGKRIVDASIELLNEIRREN
jgi:neutral ceramidase